MQPLRAHTRLDMAHFDGATARVQSVPTGVCMSTPALRTVAALNVDMIHFDGQEMRARSEVPYGVSTF